MRKIAIAALATLLLIMLAISPVAAEGGLVHIVQWGESLSSIAARYGVTVEAIVVANGLGNPDVLYVGQRLAIPRSQTHSGPGFGQSYTVRPGDTLSSIAWKFNTSVQALMSANNISNADVIFVGQVLNVPGGDGGVAPPGGDACNTYVVQAGDTLSSIAWRYGTSVNALAQANNISNSSFIYVGQRLCVPWGGQAGYQFGGTTYYHTVRPGDTLSGIAFHYDASVASIVKANNLSNAALIYVGQKLVIPGHGRVFKAPKSAAATSAKSVAPPEFKSDAIPDTRVTGPYTGPLFVVRSAPVWRGSQTAHGADPVGLTTLIIRTDDQPGKRVRIKSDALQAAADSGNFPEFGNPVVAFQGIPSGIYEVWIEGEDSERARAKLDPGERAFVEFQYVLVSQEPTTRAPTGWSGRVVSNTSGATPGNGVWSILTVRGPAAGLPIILTSEGGGFQATCILGTKPEFGPAACQFGGLWPGHYIAQVDGAGIGVEIFLDGVGNAEIEFFTG
ncbi:MAG: LysM peptidoglycan-binding domain-containing protein [Anaerolineae bacterium]